MSSTNTTALYKFTQTQTLLSANLTFLFYTIFTVVLSVAFVFFKRKASKNTENLTNSFNAGGSMSISMLANTIVSQWTWAASLLQSTTVGTQVI
jgi:hypothetical protein